MMMLLQSPATIFASIFVLAVAISLGMQLWLSWRQQAHVARHRDTVPAAFAGRIPLAAHQKAADYTLAKQKLGRLDLVVGTLWLLALTLGGLLQGLSDIASRITQTGGILHGLLLFGLVAGFVIDLPFSLYRTFRLEERFGFNKMTPRLFVSDLLKNALQAVIIGAPLLAIVLWLMDRAGDAWWVWTWAFWLIVNLAAMVIYPIFIAPLYNKFSPLEDESLIERIRALLARCGFAAKGLFVMDGSRRSAHGNAYFTGFGASRRIVFYDTLLKSLTPGEVEAVLAHELGHFHHRHIWQRLAVIGVISFVLLAVLGYLVRQPWFFNGLGVETPGNAVALILFSLVLPALLFPLTPLMSLWSRKHEFQADQYAMKQANAEELVSALVKLYEENASTLTPDPLHSLFYDSHPPASIRVTRLQSA